MAKRKINLRKVYRWILAIAFILVAIFIVWRYIITRGYESAVGSYITTGGQSYLVIKKGFFRSLAIDEGFFILNQTHLARPGSPKVFAKYRNNRLFIFQKETYEPSRFWVIWWLFSVNKKYKSAMVLEPSKTIPGDWDLLHLEMSQMAGGPGLVIHSSFWKQLFGSDSRVEFKETLSKAIRPKEILYFELDPAKAPIRSFLHRVEDFQMTKYFRARFHEISSDRTLDSIRELVSKHPTDSWLRIHEVEQEALNGDVEKAGELWNKWEAENKSCQDALLLKNAQYVSRLVSIARLHKNYPVLTHYNDAFSETSSLDFEGRKKWLLNLFDAGQIMYPEYPLVPAILSPGYKYADVSNFLNMQVTTKVFRIHSTMGLFLGQREESLRILSALYLLGSSIRMNFYDVDTYIGLSVQNIAIGGLTIYALNACETKEDLEEFRSFLEILNREKVPTETGNPYYNCLPAILSYTNASGEDYSNVLEIHTRSQTTDTRFQLLRMAIAAKYHLTTTGEFPNTETDFAPFLSEGLPEDAFSEGKTLQFIQPSDDEFFVYSIGKYEKEKPAKFSYDPTNGTISPGDVYIRIPREREYPFPGEGVRAANAYEFLKQFPNGLPADAFAYTNGLPWSIIESTEDHPLVIFSLGPDTNESDFIPYVGSSSETNKGEFEPVPTPERPPNASYGRSLQRVMRRSDTYPPLPGHWTLYPPYDPTNGTVSRGNIFIEIPR